jgi:glycosyltransferase involved in cell wall biosynthesis
MIRSRRGSQGTPIPGRDHRLIIIETHPIQYHAPVWRTLAKIGIPIHVVYGSDFSVQGYRDQEFCASFAWDQDLLSGVPHQILHPSGTSGGPSSYDEVPATGLNAALENLAPSALLVCGYTHPLDRAALLWALRRRVPILFRTEASDHAVSRHPFKALVRSTLLRLLYSQVRFFLSIGEEASRHYRRHGVPDRKILFSPYAVETAPFCLDRSRWQEIRGSTRRELAIPQQARVILFSGKLSARKGVDLLPAAAGSLPHQELVLLFLGDGPLRKELEAAQPGVRKCFVGFRNQSELSRYYLAADLLCLPSRHSETWGLVVNEALHHGLPAVVSDRVGCRHDLITPGSTGEVFPCGDVSGLAAALHRCLAYAGTSASAEACRERISAYSIEAAAAGIRQAWEQLMPCGS